MKILLYTISDFKEDAIECIDMMKKHIIGSVYDFFIISNKHIRCKYDIIVDDSCSNYIGFLKYSNKLPDGYDQYIYLDSDIICFDKIDRLFSPDTPFSIVKETKLMSEEWFFYRHSTDNRYIDISKKICGLNAGSFAFKNVDFLAKVRSLFEPYKSNDVYLDARLEQSSFNFAILNQVDFDLDKCLDLTPHTMLFVDDRPFEEKINIYHFCGFVNEMKSKLNRMKNFYDRIPEKYI